MSAAEGFGLPPLEGMLFGCLPVVSNIPAHVENIGSNGVLIENIDAESVALGIKTALSMLEDNEVAIREQLSRYVRDNFGLEVVTNQWKKVLLDIHTMHTNSIK